ncbi:Rz1-like lysis system protein LysC [Pseudomonas aeruginosa]|nr:Rz1-like lysis system protein LysC [Pseudomonas aeruginosa]
MTRPCKPGLISLCLMLLAGCTSAPPSPEQTATVSGCPVVTRCSLLPAQLQNNGELSDDSDYLMSAWAECAAKVDTVVDHNQQHASPAR